MITTASSPPRYAPRSNSTTFAAEEIKIKYIDKVDGRKLMKLKTKFDWKS